MYNMSYCRWENTAGAFQECLDDLDSALNEPLDPDKFDSEEEMQAVEEERKNDPLAALNLSDTEKSAFCRMVGQMQTFQKLLEDAGISENDIAQFNVY